jgi:hypothetical protein
MLDEEQETLIITAQPVLLNAFYKDLESDLVVLATGLQSGIVFATDLEVHPELYLGHYAEDWMPFSSKTEWEYFKGELVICNPTIPVGDNSEEISDDTT